ncbi:MAG: DUF1003 domain-containing protein [Sphingopyxis sp.]|uniref:DUF1003 domain-containing protein n=1 Tax=Sphingopyxis sp. TaxID=1908224 RepID=UPI002ABD0C32|nr:DUF1003 domain-containing protein [Sphingopyxis sp.]MDZ3831103.1 DUF1003 domain-containing protein [Sphingopyxis sp.]
MSSDTHLTDLSLRLLGRAFDQLDPEERRVVQAIADRAPTSRDAADLDDAQAGFGDRLADRVAAVGGSWSFIVIFALILFGWMLLNSGVLERWGMAFDPYPYIFLNLMLSTLAAVQAPIIMMSQNRQAAKDRLSASVDYEINLRAELEIMRLHEKIDQMRLAELVEKVDALHARLAEGDRDPRAS